MVNVADLERSSYVLGTERAAVLGTAWVVIRRSSGVYAGFERIGIERIIEIGDVIDLQCWLATLTDEGNDADLQ